MGSKQLTFEQVLREELTLLRGRDALKDEPVSQTGVLPLTPRKQNIHAKAHRSQLVGLAFSGGGIRSATFNLGVLQALARFGLLRWFDYLSTVSGGGYIGSWLSAWIQREGIDEVETRLEREIPRREKGETIPSNKDWSPITFLRRYSNYLTPTTGFFSVDTWTAVATYLRNLLLNLSILVLILAGVLLLPRLFVWPAMQLDRGLDFASSGWRIESPVLLNGALIGALVALGRLLWFTTHRLEPKLKGRRAGSRTATGPQITRSVVIPLLIAVVLIAVWLPLAGLPAWLPRPFSAAYANWMAATALASLLCWSPALAGMVLPEPGQSKRQLRQRRRRAFWTALSAVVGGGVGGVLLCWLGRKVAVGEPSDWLASATWTPPAVMLTFTLIAAVQVGFSGRALFERHRQWWSRVSGWLLILALAWIAVFWLVFYGPALFQWLAGELGVQAAEYLSLSWLLATGIGIWLGRSPITGGRRPTRHWFEPIAAVTPYIFILGLAVGIVHGTNEITIRIIERIGGPVGKATLGGEGFADIWLQEARRSGDAIGEYGWLYLAMALALALVASVVAMRVDVNAFSMHNFYRNRLIRAYLGASRVTQRNPDLFTGFDPKDDFPLSDLALPGRGAKAQRPLQILNTTVNITAGEELAWQERKAASFFFTPLHFGFDPGKFDSKADEAGFRRIPQGDPRFSLGTAMAISGAAVNPNMGQHSSPALAFMMTIFNTRLGWWLRNPDHPAWSPEGPRLALSLLLRELRGSAKATSRYVNLSDGGFFDNLGIYELVRRRCRFILACDAEADPEYRFSGLGNAIRRCRADFGIDIQIRLDPIRRQGESGLSRWHCAVGKILYDPDDGAPTGTLVYLKASLTGDEPEDLLNYAGRYRNFPHESTADQWFGEAQFESYRTLGFHETQELLETAGQQQLDREAMKRGEQSGPDNIESVFVAIKHAWYPPSKATARSFTRHTERLVEIFHRLRRHEDLKFLDRNLYLDLEAWKKTGGKSLGEAARRKVHDDLEENLTPEQARAGFYLCSSMIQLMENVYLDLELDQEASHPDNRGWMNLFRHWASTRTFRKTWAVSAATYGARFQTFCRRHLALDIGTVWVEVVKIPDAARNPDVLSRMLARSDSSADKPELELLVEKLKELTPFEVEVVSDLLGHDKTVEELSLLRMSVLQPESVPRRTKVRRTDYDTEPAGAEMSFNIGFALLCPVDGARGLRYFRIRNHLRSLGLGRQAMQCLHLLDDPVTVPKLTRRLQLFDAGRRHQLKNLFRSVINEEAHRQRSS